MRGEHAVALILVWAGIAACGDAARRDAPGLFTPPEVASASTANGATPMFAVTPGGAQVLSWVAPDPAGVERLHIEVRQQEIAAGVLDVAHHARRRVDHALASHEADAARLVDLHALRVSEARLERGLHGAS